MLDKRTRKGKTEYLIGWKDCPPYKALWEPMEHLENAKKAIKDFEQAKESHKPAPKSQGARKRDKPRKK